MKRPANDNGFRLSYTVKEACEGNYIFDSPIIPG